MNLKILNFYRAEIQKCNDLGEYQEIPQLEGDLREVLKLQQAEAAKNYEVNNMEIKVVLKKTVVIDHGGEVEVVTRELGDLTLLLGTVAALHNTRLDKVPRIGPENYHLRIPFDDNLSRCYFMKKFEDLEADIINIADYPEILDEGYDQLLE